MMMVVMAAGRDDDPSFPAITVVMVMMTIILGYLEARPGLIVGFINGVESGFGVRYRI